MRVGDEGVGFYAQLGLAITNWAVVEGALSNVAQVCMPFAERDGMTLSFYAIDNFRSKLAFVHALIAYKNEDDETRSHWLLLHAEATRLAKHRNTLAHRPVMGFEEEHNPPGRRWALVEWQYREMWPRDRTSRKVPPGSLCIRDIALIGLQFIELSNALRRFSGYVYSKKGPLPASFAPIERPPTIRELDNQIREALGQPPKPLRKKSSV
jgi:hypothetical protein